MFYIIRFAAACTACAFVAFASMGAVSAQTSEPPQVSVTVDGNDVPIEPPPIERAGRIFVPLRGIFQTLGASVVYADGVINATSSGREISLRVGSPQAEVNGQPEVLDVAPFIVGESTYVPLRFISQSLGATVSWEPSENLVAIQTHGRGAPPPESYAPPPPQRQYGGALERLEPPRDADVAANRPRIAGDFTQPVDPDSVHIFLDGVNVTDRATRSSSGFVYAPPSPLQPMQHTVRVTGTFRSGQPFTERWAFTSGMTPRANMLSIVTPPDDAAVPPSFELRGMTDPGARVHIVAGTNASASGPGGSTYHGDTIADAQGRFAQRIDLSPIHGAQIGMTITSTDPNTGESAEQRLRLIAE
jgi:hypothetical protein